MANPGNDPLKDIYGSRKNLRSTANGQLFIVILTPGEVPSRIFLKSSLLKRFAEISEIWASAIFFWKEAKVRHGKSRED